MSSSDQDKQQRNREIAHNEAVRQTTSAVRVSSWAIVFAIIFAVIMVGVVWAWLNH
jgi:cobalamin biosynthesis Mg chelatase CobN